MHKSPVAVVVPLFVALALSAVSRAAEAQSQVEGHIGIATPFVTVARKTTTIGDQFTLLDPIGIGFKLSPKLVMDFETVVATAVHPGGITGLVVDPGLVYDTGPLAIGLRVAWKINAKENVGLIPLFNRALVHGDHVTWFVEAAFPTFASHDGIEFNAVLHTGLGF
jgi:hypothetical protein